MTGSIQDAIKLVFMGATLAAMPSLALAQSPKCTQAAIPNGGQKTICNYSLTDNLNDPAISTFMTLPSPNFSPQSYHLVRDNGYTRTYLSSNGAYVTVPSAASGFMILNDPDAGLGCPYYLPPLNAAAGFLCSSGQSFAMSSQNSAQQTRDFTVNFPAYNQGATTCSANLTDFFDPGSACPGQVLPQPPAPQDATVQIQWITGAPVWSSHAQQQAMQSGANDLGWIGLGVSTLALRLSSLGSPLIGFGLSALSQTTSVAGSQDPPDSNYTVVVTPTPPNVDVSTLLPAGAQLMLTLEQAIGFARAISTTTDRATGAAIAGDANSQTLQLNALPGFETQFAALMAQLPAQFGAWGQELLANGVDPRTLSVSDVTAFQQSITQNGLPSSTVSGLAALGADTSAIAQIQALLAATDPGQAASLLQNLFKTGPVMPPVLPAQTNLQQYAAVLPASRSAQVGSAVTAFATIINSGTFTATGCKIMPDPVLSPAMNFTYQTTDPATNALTGTANTPADIPAGKAQTFVIAATPTIASPPAPANFVFFCSNANVAPQVSGLDTLLLSGSTSPTPDIIALAATLQNDGIVHVTNGSPPHRRVCCRHG
jgi:hypothetical protein